MTQWSTVSIVVPVFNGSRTVGDLVDSLTQTDVPFIILVASVLAGPLGLGGSNNAFGPRQIAGTVAGVIVAAVGLYLTRRN
jgi:hypothetical protein